MTDGKTATELLREMLDERGVSCQTNYLHASWRVGQKLYDAADNFDGTLTVDNLTPEQAVAATLGSAERTCHADEVTHRDCKYSVNRGWKERTCKPLGTIRYDYEGGYAGFEYETELSCGHMWRDSYGDYPDYCPNCGAKVIA